MKPFEIRPKTDQDNPNLTIITDKDWGGNPLIVHNEKVFLETLEGFLAIQDEKIIGLILFRRFSDAWEIILFETYTKFTGIGTQLLHKLLDHAKNQNCKKMDVMTTNDNMDALRFYQKRGFTICGIHLDIVKQARELKPSIPELGDYGIAIRDEILLTHQIA